MLKKLGRSHRKKTPAAPSEAQILEGALLIPRFRLHMCMSVVSVWFSNVADWYGNKARGRTTMKSYGRGNRNQMMRKRERSLDDLRGIRTAGRLENDRKQSLFRRSAILVPLLLAPHPISLFLNCLFVIPRQRSSTPSTLVLVLRPPPSCSLPTDHGPKSKTNIPH